jgi:hydrogenase maturation protease
MNDSPASVCRTLVIGYGNTLRSDDGAGPKVAEALGTLELQGVRTLSCALLGPELAEPVSEAESVVFVDAAIDTREVQLRTVVPADSSQLMAHAAEPATVLALARDVFGHAPQAWLLTLPVENIELGETFSPTTQRAIGTATRMLRQFLREQPQMDTDEHSAAKPQP